MRYLLLSLLMIGLAGCAGQAFTDAPRPTTNGAGATVETGPAAAVQELVANSRTSAANGDYALALADIERAIRIDARNPYLWLELGEIHLAQGDPRQAAGMARKALSVAGEDRVARAAAERLLSRVQ